MPQCSPGSPEERLGLWLCPGLPSQPWRVVEPLGSPVLGALSSEPCQTQVTCCFLAGAAGLCT